MKLIKQALNMVYSKLALTFLKLMDQKDFSYICIQEKFQS